MADIFDGANEVQVSSISFSKVGDEVVGYFTGNRKDIMTQNGPSVVYEVKGLFGSFHLAETTDDGNGNKVTKIKEPAIEVDQGKYYTLFGGKKNIDDLFRQSKPGQKIGIRFVEAVPSKVKGHSAFKKFKCVNWPEFDPEITNGTELITETPA